MTATLKDIADRVGKSVTTVSRALHDYDDVSPQTKQLVLKVAAEIGYQPNTLAQRLQKQSSDTIGLIIPTYGPRFSDPFFSELLAGIGNKANFLGFDLLVSTHAPGEQELEAYRHMVQSRKVDGFILVRTRKQDQRIDYLRKIGFPFVAFGRVEGPLDFPLVDEDSKHGMRLVANHLIELGHQKIGCIAPSQELMFAHSRLNGFKEGLAENDVFLEDRCVMIGDLTQRSGYEKASMLLELDAPPTAIAACNDLMAFGAIRAAHERGLTVGKDVAITGFDDIPFSEHFHPPLTTVHQPIYQIGGRVCELLIRQLTQKELPPEQIILKPTLVVRQSCGSKIENNTKGGG